jgi:hypothetical protein
LIKKRLTSAEVHCVLIYTFTFFYIYDDNGQFASSYGQKGFKWDQNNVIGKKQTPLREETDSRSMALARYRAETETEKKKLQPTSCARYVIQLTNNLIEDFRKEIWRLGFACSDLLPNTVSRDSKRNIPRFLSCACNLSLCCAIQTAF